MRWLKRLLKNSRTPRGNGFWMNGEVANEDDIDFKYQTSKTRSHSTKDAPPVGLRRFLVSALLRFSQILNPISSFTASRENTKKSPATRHARVFQQSLMEYVRERESKGLARMLGMHGRGIEGKKIIDFSSNDYLGLSCHPKLISAAKEYAERWGVGGRASRLLLHGMPIYEELEAKIAQGKKMESALVFVSGFQANASVIAAILDRRVLGGEALVFADRLNHASMHQGCELAGARQVRYRHLDMEHLESLLEKHAEEQRPKFILSETVFSMDGDLVDVEKISQLAKKYGAFLYLDEAHATGVLGEDGYGVACGVGDIVMGTFSKALGVAGGYVACSQTMKDFLVNHCKGFIYSTAPSPPMIGAISAAWDLLPTMKNVREELQAKAENLRQALHKANYDTGKSCTQIVPVMLGETERVIAVSEKLKKAGILTSGIRPPTVPPKTGRLRVAVNANHSQEDIDALVNALI